MFAGGFRLDAAEAVCDASLDAIDALLEISLLRSEEQPDGEPRFFMLETIRDYAREQLERASSRRAARSARPLVSPTGSSTSDGQRATGQLIGNWEPEDEEHDNTRAALAWARESRRHRPRAAARRVRRPLLLAEPRAPHRGAALARRRPDARQRARTNGGARRDGRGRATHAWRQGEPDAAEELAAEAQAVFERLDDRPSLALRADGACDRGRMAGRPRRRGRFYDEAEQLFRELGQHGKGSTSILNNRAYAEIIAGNFESAERRLRELVETALRTSARLFALANHGLALARLGRLDEAAARIRRAPPRTETTKRSRSSSTRWRVSRRSRASDADDVRAARLWGASAAIREATGYALERPSSSFHDEVVPEVRERLGDGGVRPRVERRPAALRSTQAIELALMRSLARPSPSRCANATSSLTAFSTSSSDTSSVGVWM